MNKDINGSKILFYNDNNEEIMSMNYLCDEFIWYFNSSNIITITSDTEIYELLKNIMSNSYVFSDEKLQCIKTDNKLIWYSDCFYNPDDEWSIKNISYLTIELLDDIINIYCVKPLDDIIDRNIKNHSIVFSPAGNGRYSKNISTGISFQDDFIFNVYQNLLKNNKVLKKK